jgi:hypothetical protein
LWLHHKIKKVKNLLLIPTIFFWGEFSSLDEKRNGLLIFQGFFWKKCLTLAIFLGEKKVKITKLKP